MKSLSQMSDKEVSGLFDTLEDIPPLEIPSDGPPRGTGPDPEPGGENCGDPAPPVSTSGIRGDKADLQLLFYWCPRLLCPPVGPV